jgi:8-oxo-dGTP pyrophosphatase MutT (NUDIX family)
MGMVQESLRTWPIGRSLKVCSVQEDADLGRVDVVVGVVFCRGRFLAERRKVSENIDPGIVCLPGGHVEPEETRESALIREMKEELGIEVKKPRFIKRSFWIASNGERQNVYYYLVLEYKGKPVCREAEDILRIENVDRLDVEIDRQAVIEGRVMLRVCDGSAVKVAGRKAN